MITKIGKATEQQLHNRRVAKGGVIHAGKGLLSTTKFLGSGVIATANGAGKATSWLAKLLYGGPKRRMITLPATLLGALRSQDYFAAPAEYVNPINNRYDLDRGILYNTYKKGPEYERYTRVC